MARGRVIDEHVDKLIAEVYLENQDWSATQVQCAVHKILKQEDASIKDNWPGINAIQGRLQKLRNQRKMHIKERLDEPWSLVCLIQNDLPTEAILLLLDIVEKKRHSQSRKPLTIRQALWVSKLRCIIQPPRVTVRFCRNTTMSLLYDWAVIYARKQQVNEIIEWPFDTSELDRMITSYPEQYVLSALFGAFFSKVEGQDEKIHELVQQINEYIDIMNSLYELGDKYSVSENYSEEDGKLFKEAMKRLRDFYRIRLGDHQSVNERSTTMRLDPVHHVPVNVLTQDKSDSDLSHSEDDTNTAWDHFELGGEFMSIGCPGMAVKQFSIAIRLKPNWEDPYLSRGRAYEKIGEFQKASEDFLEAGRLDPRWVDAVESSVALEARRYENTKYDFSDLFLKRDSDVEDRQARMKELMARVDKRHHKSKAGKDIHTLGLKF